MLEMINSYPGKMQSNCDLISYKNELEANLLVFHESSDVASGSTLRRIFYRIIRTRKAYLLCGFSDV
jgi:hypothetical protein